MPKYTKKVAKKTASKKKMVKKTVKKATYAEAWVHYNTNAYGGIATGSQVTSGLLFTIPLNPYLAGSVKVYNCAGAPGATQTLQQQSGAIVNQSPPYLLTQMQSIYQRIRVKKVCVEIGQSTVPAGTNYYETCSQVAWHHQKETTNPPSSTVNSLDQVAQSYSDAWFDDLSVYKGKVRKTVMPEPVLNGTAVSIHKNGFTECSTALNVDYGQVWAFVSVPGFTTTSGQYFHLNVHYKCEWDISNPSTLGIARITELESRLKELEALKEKIEKGKRNAPKRLRSAKSADTVAVDN